MGILFPIGNSKKSSAPVSKSILTGSKKSYNIMFAGISKFEISIFVTGNKSGILGTIKNIIQQKKDVSPFAIKVHIFFLISTAQPERPEIGMLHLTQQICKIGCHITHAATVKDR
ncbi:hypothetical protein NPIL_37011 [Nephila pilipes]|uniref:Uncharacterized protein n=1 Tax=Nephila pilipes TaxID=299642 RepID=A0A8X6UHD5_NEPPI|nr:hypothetical protein NPIL_37011 [Nephila pilipes]